MPHQNFYDAECLGKLEETATGDYLKCQRCGLLVKAEGEDAA